MPLSVGHKLGRYEIVAPIGKGGMGEVYRARDTRLNRDVANKVSAERFSERFEREARAIAALNHPNICHLYDVGPNYLVMELVEGPTLAERIKEGAVSLEQALPVIRQIAGALESSPTAWSRCWISDWRKPWWKSGRRATKRGNPGRNAGGRDSGHAGLYGAGAG